MNLLIRDQLAIRTDLKVTKVTELAGTWLSIQITIPRIVGD